MKQCIALLALAPIILKLSSKVLNHACSLSTRLLEPVQPAMDLGEITEISEDKVIPNKNLSIMDGALAVYGSMDLSWRAQQLQTVGKNHGFDVFTPLKDFTEEQRHVLLYGDREPLTGQWSNGASMWMREGWEGVIPQTMRLYRQTESTWRKEDIEKFMTSRPCTTCNGKKLQPVVLAVKVLDKSIIDVTDLSIEEAVEFFLNLPGAIKRERLNHRQTSAQRNQRTIRFSQKRWFRLPVTFTRSKNLVGR